MKTDDKDPIEREVKNFAQKLYAVANRDTAYPANQAGWTEDNRFFGHCAIVVAMVYDRFGGKIKRGVLKNLGYSHYWNEIEGIDIDVTKDQFDEEQPIVDVSEVSLERILGNDETRCRYNIMKQRYYEKYTSPRAKEIVDVFKNKYESMSKSDREKYLEQNGFHFDDEMGNNGK